MSNRGRGNTRKPVLPNLAAAGRKKAERSEEDSTNGEQRSSNRARGRGSGRGRGRGGLKAAPIIVQSEGTFTKGLSDGVLKANRLNNYGNEEVIGKLERPINGTADFIKRPKAEIDEDAKSDVPRQYDTYEWASDDDEDKIAIYEVVKPAFVSDIKKGREMPVVLPQKDEDQFQNLVQVTNKVSVKDPSVEDKNFGVKKSRVSASQMQTYANEHTNDLMLLQLPASLDVVHRLFNNDIPEEKMEVDESKIQQQPSSSTSAQPPPPQQKHCLDGLPTGVEIGKLQLLKNGQARLIIGDRVMDVQQAIPSQMFETIVQTQTFAKPKQEPDTSSQTSSSVQTTGSMTVLGNVGDSFLCTYNVAWDG